jgi:hypothetical protein
MEFNSASLSPRKALVVLLPAAILLAAAYAMAGPGSAGAQEPAAPCTGLMLGPQLTVDPRLTLPDVQTVVDQVPSESQPGADPSQPAVQDQVTVTWGALSAVDTVDCI